MLQEHDEIIKMDIMPRLRQVEQAQVDTKYQIDKIQNSQQSLELAVLKDGQETRNILNRFMDHFFYTDKEKIKSDAKVTLKRLSTKEKVLLAVVGSLCGAGGLLATIVSIMQILN